MKRAKLWPVSTVHPMQTESGICWVGSAGKGESWNAWTHQKPFYSNEKYTGPEIWHPTAVSSWSPHCCSDHRWASSSATRVGTKPHPTLSTHEKIHSSEILVIMCRTPGFKMGKKSVWKRANKGGLWISNVIPFNLLKTGVQMKTARINPLKESIFLWTGTIPKSHTQKVKMFS